MANGISRGLIATSTVLVLLVLLQATLVWHPSEAAPAKRNDILAGTEFLSVFINGAMAPTPQRRRGLRRGRHPATDHAAAESRQQEASIYRISRAKPTVIDGKPYGASGNDDEDTAQVLPREDGAKFYPIGQKDPGSRDDLASLIDDLGIAGVAELKPDGNKTGEQQSSNGVNQRVIGVSVTSTVEATPYKVRVEHYDSDDEATTVTRPPTTDSSSERPRMSGVTTPIATTVATSAGSVDPTRIASTTPIPARLVTEELSNIVSESNRSEFSVDEGSPRTSWRGRARPVPATPSSPSASSSFRGHYRKEAPQKTDAEEAEPVEPNFELPEPRETHDELAELVVGQSHQARKAGRHYEAPSLYNQPSKVYAQPAKVYSKPSRVYSEPAKVYSEPAKIYSEPERVYSEPAKIYSEPSKIYSEPSKVYSEPAKVYSEPAKIYSEPEKVYSVPSKIYSEPSRIYSEPAKVYSEPAKVYSVPAKVYGNDGRPVEPPAASQRDAQREPEEENYEVDEAVSVESNGKVHGPQSVTESPPSGAASSSDAEDGHKVGYVVEGRNYRKYRVEERTPDGFIVGEYGVVSHDDGSLRGVRYTADGTINPRLIYDALMKFLAL